MSITFLANPLTNRHLLFQKYYIRIAVKVNLIRDMLIAKVPSLQKKKNNLRNMSLWTSLITELSMPSISTLAPSIDELSIVQTRLDDIAILSRVMVSADAVISIVTVSVLLGWNCLSPACETIAEASIPWWWADTLDFFLSDGDGSVVVAHVWSASGIWGISIECFDNVYHEATIQDIISLLTILNLDTQIFMLSSNQWIDVHILFFSNLIHLKL